MRPPVYVPPAPSRYEAEPPPAPPGADPLTWPGEWMYHRRAARKAAVRYRRRFAHHLWARVHGPPPESWPPDVIHLTLYVDGIAKADANEDGA